MINDSVITSFDQVQFSDPLQEFLQRLESGGYDPHQRYDGSWESLCPSHADPGTHRKRNLSINVGEKGQVLVHCHRGGCTYKSIAERLGMSVKQLYQPTSNGHVGSIKQDDHPGYENPRDATRYWREKYGDPFAIYRYPGNFAIYRFHADDGHKEMIPVSKNGNGRWRPKRPEGKLPLYNLECLEGLDEGSTVWVFEGEKCVELAKGIGLKAVTSAGGSSAAKGSDWAPLRPYKAILWPDADSTGEKYMEAVAGILGDVGAKYVVARLPGWEPSEGDDLEQWLAWNGEIDARGVLEGLIDQFGLFAEKAAYAGRSFGSIQARLGKLEHLWENWIVTGNLNMICSKPKHGKTRFYIALMKCLWEGTPWPDGAENRNPRGSKTIVIPYDKNHIEIAAEMEKMGIPDEAGICASDPDDIDGISLLDIEDPRMHKVLTEILKANPSVKMVVVDTLTYASNKSLCKPEDMKGILNPLMDLAAKHKIAILLLIHESKEGNAYGMRITERARVLMRMERYSEEDPSRLRFYVKDSNFPSRPAITVIHDLKGLRYGPDEGPIENVGKGKTRGPAPVKSSQFAEWLVNQLEAGPQTLFDLIRSARADGLLPEPTDKQPKPSISPLYAAKDRIEKLRPGTSVEESDEAHMGRTRKTWKLCTGVALNSETWVADRQAEIPY